jgi:esterase
MGEVDMQALRLRVHRQGTNAPGPTVVLLHGLFGNGGNWRPIGRALAERRLILAPDLRNHGASPHKPRMGYPEMAADVLALLDAEGIDRAVIIGHSMGGKTAMWLALTAPERVAALGVVDIAPVRYPPGFEALVAALRSLPLEALRNRANADARLAAMAAGALTDARVRGFLLQNLRRGADGRWSWRCNLDAIADALPTLLDFPAAEGRQFAGPTQVVYGTKSTYIGAGSLAPLRALFPLARLRAVANAGHWVHADDPRAFLAAIEPLLHAAV